MCGQILTKKNISEHDPYICSKCYKKINFVQSPCCMKCSRPLVDDTREYCIDCSNKIRHFDAGMALMIHDDISRKIIYDLKYAGRRDNADMIGYELTKRAGALIRQWDPQVVIPVPVHKSKRIQRGFNQAETLALKLRTQIPVDCDYLIRHKKPWPRRNSYRSFEEEISQGHSLSMNTESHTALCSLWMIYTHREVL